MRKSIFTIISAATVGFAAPSPAKFSQEVEQFKNQSWDGKPKVYRTKARPYSESDFLAKLTAAKGFGANLTTRKTIGKMTKYESADGTQAFGYDEAQSRYFYVDQKAQWFDKKGKVDIESIKSAAAARLQEFLGTDARNFEPCGRLETTIEDKGDAAPWLASVSFIYNRKVDGKTIHGSTHNLIVELGANNKVRSVTYNNPDLVVVRSQERLVKKSKLSQLSQDQLAERNPSLKSANFLKAEETYFVERLGSEVTLTPHASFLVDKELAGKAPSKKWFHLKASAEAYSDIQAVDIEGGIASKP